MKDVALLVLAVAVVALAATVVRTEVLRRRRARRRSGRRILFPVTPEGVSEPALETTLRLARAERATLVPAYLARVPLILPLESAVPREAERALPMLEAIEQRAARAGVASEARIERGRTLRHALRELLAHERHDRVIVAAGEDAGGLAAADVAWLLGAGGGEVLVVRPAQAPRARRPSPTRSRCRASGRRRTPSSRTPG